jgi:hypothetical protein
LFASRKPPAPDIIITAGLNISSGLFSTPQNANYNFNKLMLQYEIYGYMQLAIVRVLMKIVICLCAFYPP